MPTHHIYHPVKELYIELHRVDQGGTSCNTFHTLHEFKLFLIENPQIVKILKEGIDTSIEVKGDIDLETRI
jgi:hypothetical protein